MNETKSLRFVDLFAGIGGFHLALRRLGHNCVFASEIDKKLRDRYEENFGMYGDAVQGDITNIDLETIPSHDILCAGFPCQPFSKAGSQLGLKDLVQGTLFQSIIEVLEKRHPEYLILENVGNFSRHDNGNTWKIVKENLEQLGYDIVASEPKTSNGIGLISPHHYGFPHQRERFYILGTKHKIPVALRDFLSKKPEIKDADDYVTLSSLIQETLSDGDKEETALNKVHEKSINHWNKLLQNIPRDKHIPSPIWGDEIDAYYPYNEKVPSDLSKKEAILLGIDMDKLPSYAKRMGPFPRWKQKYIENSRKWFNDIKPYIPEGWVEGLKEFHQSLRKLEWHCDNSNTSKNKERDIWDHIIQVRSSGLRVRPYDRIPALVAFTSTQIPILGPHRRHITRQEGLLFQGFDKDHVLPKSRTESFRALGNAVHVGVVGKLAEKLLHNG